MKKGFTALAIVWLILSVAGCGGNSGAVPEAYSTGYDSGEAMEKSYAGDSLNYAEAEEAAYDEVADEIESGGADEIGNASKRKLITNVNIEAESDNVDSFADRIEKKVKALNGYIESSSVYSDSDYYDGSARKYADITARIPADKLDEFLQDVEGNSNITSRNVNTQDVTLEYTDTEAHERALVLEQESLEKMLEMAETVEDIIAIQSQLTDVRYRLDSIRSRLRTLDNEIDYSTVYISVRETAKFTVTREETVWERIRNGFADNLMDVMDAIADFLIWIITHIPALIIFGLVVFVIVFIVRRVIKSVKKKKDENG